MSKRRIIAATQNQHKIKEFNAITMDFDMELVSQDDAGFGDVDIVEDGNTFEENSAIKAETICKLSGEPAIADDSGIMVDALGGAPGIHSARYSGEPKDDERNNDKLLEALKDVPDSERTAKYVCVITLAFPNGDKLVARGECPGHILHSRHGSGGFGYDPLFVPDGYSDSFGMLPYDVKNSMSHRAQALIALKEQLKNYEG